MVAPFWLCGSVLCSVLTVPPTTSRTWTQKTRSAKLCCAVLALTFPALCFDFFIPCKATGYDGTQ